MTPIPPSESDILNSLSDAVIWARPVFDQDNNIIDFEICYANKKADEAINHPRGGINGLLIKKDGIPSIEQGEQNFLHYLEVYEKGQGEHSFLAPYSHRFFEMHRTKYKGGVLSITRDRQEQRAAEKREQEQSLVIKGIIDNAPIGIAFYIPIRDENGTIIDFRATVFNNKLSALTAFSNQERSELTLNEILKKLNTSGQFEKYRDVVETGNNLNFEYFSPRVQRWLALYAAKAADGFVLIITDISETKKIESELQQQKEYLANILNTSLNAINTMTAIRDENGVIVDLSYQQVNNAFEKAVDRTADEVIGKSMLKLFPGAEHNGLFDIYKHVIESGEPLRKELHYRGHNNEERWFDIAVARLDENTAVGSFMDVSAIRHAQTQLEKLVEELKRSNTNLEEFAYAASHDLKEPIRKIHFFSDKLKDRLHSKLDEQEIQLFSRLENASKRMGSLIDDLLSYSQISIQPRSFEQVDLNHLIDLVKGDLELEIEEKNATIEVEDLPVITGHFRQLQQLFQNLIGNALKYAKPGVPPLVKISCSLLPGSRISFPLSPEEQNKNFYILNVQDNGIGFEQKDAERIFNVFQRLHGNSEYRGTGVGLSIARKVAENHNGYIKAESNPGEGASFRVYLPVLS